MDDFSALAETEHMLRWLADEPYAAIRSSIADALEKQVAGSQLKEFRVTSSPQWLSGVRPSKEGDSQSLLVRAGVAFEFTLSVESEGALHQLSGVYTWVGVQLDRPGQQEQRVWMDLDGNLASFGSDGLLMIRVYFERDREIRIVSTPPGEAPEHIRQAWIGILLPLHRNYPVSTTTRGYGVCSGPKNRWLAWLWALFGGGIKETGYIVDAQLALERLEHHAPDAAKWWRENTPHLFRCGQCLLFDERACEPLEGSG
jgi:hypothetical protein